MDRVLFVRGSKAPPWEAPVLRQLSEFGYDARFLVPLRSPSINSNLQITGRSLRSNPLADRLLIRSFPAKLLNYGFYIKTDEFASRYFRPGKLFRKTDVLHLTDDIYVPGIQALKYSANSVITIWENIPFHFGIENGHPTRRYREFVFNHVKKFLPVTQESANYLHSMGIAPEKIQVVHPGIEINAFANTAISSPLAKEIHKSGKFVILGVARMEFFKGITVTLRSLKELLKTRSDFIYVHLGSGSPKFTAYIKEMATRMGLGNCVMFPGSVSYEKMPDIYNACDVFLLPSIPTLLWEEQLGFSLLEAMSAGKPVIASDLPAIREVVGNVPETLFPSGNYIELSKKIMSLMDDPSLVKRIGRSGQERVITEFNSKITAKKYAEVYKGL